MDRSITPLALVAVFTSAALAACASHPSERFPEHDAMCGGGRVAYRVEPHSDEKFPACAMVRWDGEGEGGNGHALCCPS